MIWSDSLETLNAPPIPLQDWLLKPFVLTDSLKQCHTELALTLLQQGPQSLSLEYQHYLNSSTTEGWSREIITHDHQNPLTYGQVSMPITTYLAYQQSFDQLGTNPIGQTLLYNKSNVIRGPFSFGMLSASHPLFVTLQSLCPQNKIPAFWARRSLFLWDKLPLMVLEVFFPTLPDYPMGV
jgi:chorismate-pyruvate lyase